MHHTEQKGDTARRAKTEGNNASHDELPVFRRGAGPKVSDKQYVCDEVEKLHHAEGDESETFLDHADSDRACTRRQSPHRARR
jgi:hypothetical protein